MDDPLVEDLLGELKDHSKRPKLSHFGQLRFINISRIPLRCRHPRLQCHRFFTLIDHRSNIADDLKFGAGI